MFLNIGCGPVRPDGWVNIDPDPQWTPLGEFGVCDPLHGLPFADGEFDGAVAHHVLMMVDWVDLPRWLNEVRRVTNGPLRVSVPDVNTAIEAWLNGDRSWFPVEAASTDDAFCRYVTQGGATRSIFTRRRIHDLLAEHYGKLRPVEFCRTWLPGLDALDTRPAESIYAEAW